MADLDAVIGQLYVKLAESEQGKVTLLQVIAGLKSGDISLDRIEVLPNGITIHPGATDEA